MATARDLFALFFGVKLLPLPPLPILGLKGKFSSGTEGALASKFSYDFE